MFYTREGFPEEDDLVLCTVTSVQYNSVFCTLDEHENKTGMIHISEVTAGRIRNIRDYVQEGRKVVCKVLRVDLQKGHIDLSLRRVNERQRREKMSILKQEQKAENLLAHLATESGKDPEKFYKEVAPAVFEHYEYLTLAFQDIADGSFSLEETKLDPKLAGQIEALVKERITPTQVEIEGKLSLSTYASGGIELVKEALMAAESAAEGVTIKYLGAGAYNVRVSAEDYKQAEKRLKSVLDAANEKMAKHPASTVKFERTDE